MHLTLSTSDRQYGMPPGRLPGTVGSLKIAFSNLPAASAAANQPAQAVPRSVTVVNRITSDTQQSSIVKSGLLQDDQTTLISPPAKDAIGANGLRRLEAFFHLQAGWDGTASKPIDLNSVVVFSRFFEETRLNPKRLGVFMSARGNVVVNWPEQDGQLVELEFHSSGVDYFIESSGDEGTVANSDIGFSKLFQLISESVTA
ncbi:hypothetical protein F7Q92_18610 [Ideonella dechloratans]|uniref:Uncharacterized protein n=1 Tax=Ideonella dechloratans TaxID=36863 RepID=A0A643F9V5_IDEDE|nr:hypothetical protein [Ideonella dechloratans]KAB0575358.1 hypothetical protein F7Q92_18610 [Ideonella dechloratans]UFU10071.1 hypothetical protein LRM40_17515 [Ideonella dechloratans]